MRLCRSPNARAVRIYSSASTVSIEARRTRSCVGRIESVTAKVGRTRLDRPEKPPGGSHRNPTEKMSTRTAAVQKTGADCPSAATADESHAQKERGRIAAALPRLTAIARESASETDASNRVFGIASAIRLATEVWKRKD